MNTSHHSSHQSSHRSRNYPQSGTVSRYHDLERQVRSLQDQIEFTICNYEGILETEKKNTAERNEFLLYLIQSMKEKQIHEMNQCQQQLQRIAHEKEEAHLLDSQMKNIGDGVDGILEEAKKLKIINESLKKEQNEQIAREKEFDQEIESHERDIEELRNKVDEWEKTKLKWNRKQKDMLSMIEGAENQVSQIERGLNTCQETGLDLSNCEHCEQEKMTKLMNKYQNHS